MEEWKVRQTIFHSLESRFDDDLGNKVIVFTDNVAEDAVRYFKENDVGWIYPSKSYMVGICYAKWLSDYFGGDPINYLKDQTLLYNNDPYFVAYNKNSIKIYDSIIKTIGGWNFSKNQGMVPDVKEYFIKEFMLDTDPLK